MKFPKLNAVHYVVAFAGILAVASVLQSSEESEVEAEIVVVTNHQMESTPAKKAPDIKETAYRNMGTMSDVYARAHMRAQDKAWLVGNEDAVMQSRLIDAWTGHTRRLLKESSDVSPLAKEIFGKLNDIMVTEYRNGGTVRGFTLPQGVDIETFMAERAKKLEVVITPIGQYQQNRRAFPSTLWYRQDWSAVNIVAVDMPDIWRVGLMYHEMGHALRHREGAASATAHSSSNDFIWEEMEMHELEYAVMNNVSSGELGDLYAIIQLHADDPSDPYSVIAAVTSEDILAYDHIVQTQDRGNFLTGIYTTQLWISLAIDTINSNGTDTRKQKIDFYRWLAEQSNSKRHVASVSR